jgi:hypothetical protein
MCPNPGIIFSCDLNEEKFSIFNNFCTIGYYIMKATWCTPIHWELSNSTKSATKRDCGLRDFNMTNKTKQTNFLRSSVYLQPWEMFHQLWWIDFFMMALMFDKIQLAWQYQNCWHLNSVKLSLNMEIYLWKMVVVCFVCHVEIGVSLFKFLEDVH